MSYLALPVCDLGTVCDVCVDKLHVLYQQDTDLFLPLMPDKYMCVASPTHYILRQPNPVNHAVHLERKNRSGSLNSSCHFVSVYVLFFPFYYYTSSCAFPPCNEVESSAQVWLFKDDNGHQNYSRG